MTNINQTQINIGQAPRVIHCDESLGLVALLVTLGLIAWVRRNIKNI